MKKVLLISMPFGALERQALGISLLKSALAKKQFACDIRYFNYDFADFIGFDNYQWVSADLPYTAFAGDWLFTEVLYNSCGKCDYEYISEVLTSTWNLTPADTNRLQQLRGFVAPFLQHCLQQIEWKQYDVVGFTSTFEQNIASLALAKTLKMLFPSLIIVFGGANWEAEMGVALHRAFPFVDYAFSGEADKSFPLFIEHLNSELPLEEIGKIKGVIYRAGNGETMYSGQAELVRQMDELPIPDFSDYFQTWLRSPHHSLISPMMLMETSRGCWWGAKNHCTFCGLNGGSMAFRSKSVNRVLEELSYLSRRWNIYAIECVDNIMDMQYFKDLLPALAASPRKYNFFYEVKANLNRKQVEMMQRAGITHIQPGIESMNNDILKLMSKGTTALQNILLLRLCKEYGLQSEWNVLYGFPGEQKEDYKDMLALLQSVRFLDAPNACGPIRLDRFSPYFNTPSKYGLTNLRPINAIKHLYPFDEQILMKISCYFDFDYKDGSTATDCAGEVIAYCNEWKQNPDSGEIKCKYLSSDTILLFDTRSRGSIGQLKLSGLEKFIYEYCDDIRTIPAIRRHLENAYSPAKFADESIKAYLESMVVNNLMLHDDEHYLSLATGLKPKYAAVYQTQKIV